MIAFTYTTFRSHAAEPQPKTEELKLRIRFILNSGVENTLPDKTVNKGFKLFDISLLGLPLVLSFGTEAKFSMISTA